MSLEKATNAAENQNNLNRRQMIGGMLTAASLAIPVVGMVNANSKFNASVIESLQASSERIQKVRQKIVDFETRSGSKKADEYTELVRKFNEIAGEHNKTVTKLGAAEEVTKKLEVQPISLENSG